MNSSILVRAAWKWDGIGEVEAGGCVQVDAEKLPRSIVGPGRKTIDLGDYCIVPGLINAHTHLELSDFEQPIPHRGSFADWLASVVRHRLEAPPQDAIAAGLIESRNYGVQLVLDIAHPRMGLGTSYRALDRFIFSELLGTTRERADETWQAAMKESQARFDSAGFGLSPHAPYTMTPELIERAVEYSRGSQAPIMMHLAESRDELEWIEKRTGPVQEMLEQIVGPGFQATGSRFTLADYVAILSQAPSAFLVHGNYLDLKSLDLIQRSRDRVAVVHCPRTHAHFEHDRCPVSELLSRGISIVLGTDSRASTPNLSILEEARFLRLRNLKLASEQILRMITLEPLKQLHRTHPRLKVDWSFVACKETRRERVLDTILTTDGQPLTTIY
jgi:cytosine/adenosine deaminase-related metal-dependent hydrolase